MASCCCAGLCGCSGRAQEGVDHIEGNNPPERALIDDAADSIQLQPCDSAPAWLATAVSYPNRNVPQSHKMAGREFIGHATDFLKEALGMKVNEGNIADGPDSAASATAVANMPAPSPSLAPPPPPPPTAAAAAIAAVDANDDSDAAADAADDDVESPPAGIVEEVWRALPPELRAELAELSAEQLEASERNE